MAIVDPVPLDRQITGRIFELNQELIGWVGTSRSASGHGRVASSGFDLRSLGGARCGRTHPAVAGSRAVPGRRRRAPPGPSRPHPWLARQHGPARLGRAEYRGRVTVASPRPPGRPTGAAPKGWPKSIPRERFQEPELMFGRWPGNDSPTGRRSQGRAGSRRRRIQPIQSLQPCLAPPAALTQTRPRRVVT